MIVLTSLQLSLHRPHPLFSEAGPSHCEQVGETDPKEANRIEYSYPCHCRHPFLEKRTTTQLNESPQDALDIHFSSDNEYYDW
jgi:hypothetical protein